MGKVGKEKIEKIVMSVVANQLTGGKPNDIDISKTIKDYGSDSLDEIELLVELEHSFDIEIEDGLLTADMPIHKVCDLIYSRVNNGEMG